MSYVFHNVFYSSSAPKAANEIIDLMKRTSGSEIGEEELQVYIDKLKEKIEKANASGRHQRIQISHSQDIHYTDMKVHGQIRVFANSKWGEKDIARLDYIQVNYGWRVDSQNVLYMFSYSESVISRP